jgi:hypothetical protein
MSGRNSGETVPAEVTSAFFARRILRAHQGENEKDRKWYAHRRGDNGGSWAWDRQSASWTETGMWAMTPEKRATGVCQTGCKGTGGER